MDLDNVKDCVVSLPGMFPQPKSQSAWYLASIPNQVFQYSTQFPQDSCLKILVQAVIQGSIVSAAAMEYDAARTEEEPCGTVTKMMGKTERAKTPT